MSVSPKILQSPLFKRVSKLSQSISEKRFELAELAYECREERFHVVMEDGRCALWSEVMALALGVDVRRVQEMAQVGAFMLETQEHWTFSLTNPPPVYSRVSSAVRYRKIINDEELVEMIEDFSGDYPTVESLQSALAQIAYSETGYDAKRITSTLYRMANGGAKLIGLNGDLPEAIRADVEEAYRLNSNALRYMKERYHDNTDK